MALSKLEHGPLPPPRDTALSSSGWVTLTDIVGEGQSAKPHPHQRHRARPVHTSIGGGWLKKDLVARAGWDAMVLCGSVGETGQLKPLALLLASDQMADTPVLIDPFG